MAEFLFVTPQEIAKTTILGGSIDLDKYVFCIANTQITVLEALLGTQLYNYILTNAENNTLAGKYLELYNNYIKPITKNQALASYIEISPFTIANGGAFKYTPENTQLMDKEDIVMLSQKYSGLADMYIIRFEKWICKNPLPEYKVCQEEVDAEKKLRNIGGWYFGNANNYNTRKPYNDYLLDDCNLGCDE